MQKTITIALIAAALTATVFAQSDAPKREFRAAWLATVVNLDWPPSSGQTTEAQKAALVEILDGLHELNVNVVLFQVRTECDAFYNSAYEPWSYWLTGRQGEAPDPYYDPLAFAIEECRKRGMELHAWFNPYRAERSEGSYALSAEHVASEHPEWTFVKDGLRMLDPGLPDVREYVTSVIMDVVRNYDVDGVHFDDYFYPYSGMLLEDDATFQNYSRGFTSRSDWRRDNVNLLMQMVNDSIHAAKPHVKFGVSPFGIWKNGVPSGIVGMDAYSQIYCDAIAWLQDGSVDYLTPQCYWKIGGGQDYIKLSRWWADQCETRGRHFYPGHGAYRITDWTANEMPNQVNEDRSNAKTTGSVFFRVWDGLLDNPLGFADSLKNNFYRYPALPPVFEWGDTLKPNAPQNARFARLPDKPIDALQWDAPTPASDGDTAGRYVIYRFDHAVVVEEELDDPANIAQVAGYAFAKPRKAPAPGTYHYVVTALDRSGNESGMSAEIEMAPPVVPALAFPADLADDATDDLTFVWSYAPGASEYDLVVSEDTAFDATLYSANRLEDTAYVSPKLDGETTYYWRARSRNASGESAYSPTRSFTTAFPAAPELISPAHAYMDVSPDTTLVWASNPIAETYRLQIASSIAFGDEQILLDTTGLSDTTYALVDLDPGEVYFWRVAASNAYGESQWSDGNGFKVVKVVESADGLPTDYALDQNYPNPFNPTTTIRFALPEAGHARLTVYDLLGREVEVLANERLRAGVHEYRFEASRLASGPYFYVLSVNGKRFADKMLLVK